MIKAVLILLLVISIFPVSIITMMWGWGIQPQNWGWIAFGYLWMLLPSIFGAIAK